MRPKAVWLFELLDAKKPCGGKKGCSWHEGKILLADVEIFPTERE